MAKFDDVGLYPDKHELDKVKLYPDKHEFDDAGLYPGKHKGWMETYGGKAVNPFHVRKEDIDIVAIAHSLSLICRYNGHCKVFYSVAEHSVRVSDIVEPEYRLAALLHDAAEAYWGDVIRPLKYNLPVIQEEEEKVLKVVMNRFDVDYSKEVREAVKEADNIVGATEGRDLMYHVETWGKLPPPLAKRIVPVNSTLAEIMFYNCFNEYKGES